MCYEVATSGVEGLDTVVPVAGPSSWYDSSNRQGISMFSSMSYNYTTVLADSCASRLFADASAGRAPDAGLLDLYQRYRTYLSDAQVQLADDYGPYWAAAVLAFVAVAAAGVMARAARKREGKN